jgi:type IV pilus assembly protein PilB
MQPEASKRLQLGESLVDLGLITLEQKVKALQHHKETGCRLGESLVELGFVTEEDIVKVLAVRLGAPFIRLRKGLFDPRITDVLPRDKAELYEVLPLFRIHDTLTLAVTDPNKIHVLDVIKKLTKCTIQPVVTMPEDIARMINEVYSDSESSVEEFVSTFEEADLELVSSGQVGSFEDIAEMAGESPVINLVNQIILKAVKDRASDVHIEPEQKFFRVRFRIDGMLYEVMRQRIELHAPIISRMKIMANLDIAERRLPQDGRIQVLAQGRTIDLRFSSLPSISGEKVVLRVLDRESGVLTLNQLGFNPETLAQFRRLLHCPHGLVLVTGPTGSGKTTSLYGGIRELNSLEKNIVTIEDPVEYQFEIVNQNQVKEDIGLTFSRILKHTLRQDPDIILVGEIRDSETAEIAVQAALTGHLVLTTMHTNDASSSVTRLLEMGIEPFLLASSLIGVVAQRLVRRICPDCSVSYRPTEAELKMLGVEDQKNLQLRKGKGCEKCYDSGFRGRLGIYELLPVDAGLKSLLFDNPTVAQIYEHQAQMAYSTLRTEALLQVVNGHTTLEEIARSVFVT